MAATITGRPGLLFPAPGREPNGRAAAIWATDLIETWVKRGGRYLDPAVALWRLADSGRADAIRAIVDGIRREDRGVAIRLTREEVGELAGRIEGIERALIDAAILGPDYLVPLDRVTELARQVPEMDVRPERTDLELRHALVEVVFMVEGMARFLAESASEGRFVVLDGTFYAMRIVSSLPDGVACLERAATLWQVVGAYGAEQLDEILQEVCAPELGPHPRFDTLSAEALVSNLDLLEEWSVNMIQADADSAGLLADACRLRDFVREALGRGCAVELA